MLPRAEQAQRLYQANYQKMAGAYPQMLISNRTLFQLEADYVQALRNTWQSCARNSRGSGPWTDTPGPSFRRWEAPRPMPEWAVIAHALSQPNNRQAMKER